MHQFLGEHLAVRMASALLSEKDDETELFSDTEITLAGVYEITTEGQIIIYEYDFGNSWEHQIEFESVMTPADAGFDSARCTGGENAVNFHRHHRVSFLMIDDIDLHVCYASGLILSISACMHVQQSIVISRNASPHATSARSSSSSVIAVTFRNVSPARDCCKKGEVKHLT